MSSVHDCEYLNAVSTHLNDFETSIPLIGDGAQSSLSIAAGNVSLCPVLKVFRRLLVVATYAWEVASGSHPHWTVFECVRDSVGASREPQRTSDVRAAGPSRRDGD